jgi:uncharacterized protein DUF5916
MKYLSLTLIFLICIGIRSTYAQEDSTATKVVKKEIIKAFKIVGQKPKIDGVLNDEAYNIATPFKGKFFQMSPDNGAPSSYDTKVYILYTNYGLYIAAQMYDPDPATIPQELGKRDDLDKNVDVFALVFDPVNKGQNGFNYAVSAAGVQADAVVSPNNFDNNWDAVWNSGVQINNEGWAVEMEIPYSAIRFPKHEFGEWGFNIYRSSKRLNEESTWNFVDQEVDGFINQSGTLEGLENISPPLRLSFSPYLSGAVSHDGGSNTFSSTYAGGMDLKWGLSESFTLDMSLIPDFSQVQSDDQVLNLTPFEVRFDENRPFFTEGVELFSKGNIFYSRRVGQTRGYVDEEDLSMNEVVKTSPSTAPLLNATKISGRTAKGTGIGFFNAVSRETFATIENTENGTTREYLIDPLTNYNVLVVDQNLKNNSNVGIINTNVIREGGGRDANVTVGQIRLRDKTNTWGIFADGGYSHVVTQGENGEEVKNGFRNTLSFSKVSGKFNFSTGVSQKSDTWDINDLGFIRAPNEFRVFGRANYNIYKPFSVFNRMNTWFNITHEQLYAPRTFTDFRINGGAWFQFKNFYEAGGGFNVRPVAQYDYYEPREEGRFFKSESNFNLFLFGGSDSRKPFSIQADGGFWYRNFDNTLSLFGSIENTLRVNNKLNISYAMSINNGTNAKGFVTKVYDANDELDEIIFGNRSQQTMEHVIGINYTFNEYMALTFRLRHYWSWAEYNQFYKLEEDGTLGDTDFNGSNLDGSSDYNSNFNAFNIDMVYSWQVAPGSFVKINWKDAIFNFSNKIDRRYSENISSTVKDDHYNTLSVKFIYYIDINYFKNIGSKNNF